MRKPQHWGLVTTLREQFQGGCDQFLVTGSVAMLLYGLAYQCDEPNDLDITMINPTPETIRILQALEAVNPLPNRPGYGSDELFRFTMQGVQVDVFVEKEPVDALWYDWTQINTPMRIIQARAKLGRPKDIKSVCELAIRVAAQLSSIRK